MFMKRGVMKVESTEEIKLCFSFKWGAKSYQILASQTGNSLYIKNKHWLKYSFINKYDWLLTVYFALVTRQPCADCMTPGTKQEWDPPETVRKYKLPFGANNGTKPKGWMSIKDSIAKPSQTKTPAFHQPHDGYTWASHANEPKSTQALIASHSNVVCPAHDSNCTACLWRLHWHCKMFASCVFGYQWQTQRFDSATDDRWKRVALPKGTFPLN